VSGATATKANHGPDALVPICFSTLPRGLGDVTSSVALAVLPVPPAASPTLPVVVM